MMEQLKAAVIDNGIAGLHSYFISRDEIDYTFIPVEKNFSPDLKLFDVLIVPNGSDQFAMLKIKNQVQEFLAEGKTLLCFDGWFTNWIPGNQWVMDNSKKTIDIRYAVKNDQHNLFDGIDIDALNFNHGISGWWACGYIEAAPCADIILEDTWRRPIIVLDEKTTNGTIILTASGPLGDSGYNGNSDATSEDNLLKFYRNIIHFIHQKTFQYA